MHILLEIIVSVYPHNCKCREYLNENTLFTPLGAQPNTGIIMTQSGNLKCKKIIHIVGKKDPVKITKDVKDALQMCVTNHYTSISFPAIGTGELHQENIKKFTNLFCNHLECI